MYESALGLSNGYITGYNNSAFSAERSRYAASATSANGAISAQQALQTSGGNSLQGLYDFVSTNSGSWTGVYFPESADQACKTVTANSANWNNAYNSARSGYAASAYLRNSVTANVSNWNSCRATVYNNSAKWGDIPTKVVANSGLATGSNILYIVTGS
jgi:hypothetical protein